MIAFPARRIAAALAATAVLSGCGGGPQRTVETTPRPLSAAAADSAAIARARQDSIRLPYTEADVHFMTAMIGHHAQAVVMAQLAPDRAQSPAVKTLAERIINGQRDEIRTMQQWLRDRRKPVPEPDFSGAGMSHGTAKEMDHRSMHDSSRHAAMHDSSRHASMHAAHHPPADSAPRGAHAGMQAGAHSMPGMLSEAQMAQLATARGAEFDRLFLTYMIQHHRGAVSMVEKLFGSYGAAQDETVFKFASDVNVDQITEIARMERMLRALVFEVPDP